MGTSEKPVTVRLRLPYEDEAGFVSGFAALCRGSTIFLPTRKVQELGVRVRFELQTKDGARLMWGEGLVVDGKAPGGKSGFFVKVAGLDAASKKVFSRLKEEARRQGTRGSEKAKDDGGEALESRPKDLGSTGERDDSAEREDASASTGDGPGPGDDTPTPDSSGAGTSVPSEIDSAESAAIGIDFGAAFCRAAVVKDGEPRLIELSEGGSLLSSGVASGPGEKLLVGAEAAARRLEQPDQSVFGAKRLLGRRLVSPWVRGNRKALPFSIAADEEGEIVATLARRKPTITEVTARILETLRSLTEKRLSQPCRRAVVAVPSGLGDRPRRALREAGRLAGIEVMRIISAPMAAAIAYGAGKGLAAKRVLVMDVGAAFVDVSILTISGDRFEVVGSASETPVGGMDVDRRVQEHLIEALGQAGGPENPGLHVRQRLLEAAEQAKIALDEASSHEVVLDALWRDELSGEAGNLKVEIRREDLDGWCRDLLVDRAMDACREVLREQGLEFGQMDEVLLIGGQSRMPLLRRTVTETFGKEPGEKIPEGAVALGCALLAHSIDAASDHTVPELALKDVLTSPVLLGTPGGGLMTVVERGTKVPCERTIHLESSRENQKDMRAVLFQGDAGNPDEAEYLGTMVFADLPERPAGKTALRLRFAIDPEGLVSPQAGDEETDETRPHFLSTNETLEELTAKLVDLDTGIRELADRGGRQSNERRQDKESKGFLGGLKRLFGGGRG